MAYTSTSKAVPIIVIGNKADSFYADDTKKAIAIIEEGIANLYKLPTHVRGKPVFIPLSALKALPFCCASRMSPNFATFRKEYTDKVDEWGPTEWGSSWEDIPPKERPGRLFKKLCDNYDSSMKASRFQNLLQKLGDTVCEKNLPNSLKRVLELHARMIDAKSNKKWVKDLCSISSSFAEIGISDRTEIFKVFWDLNRSCSERAYTVYEESMDFSQLVNAIDMLQAGSEKLSANCGERDKADVIKRRNTEIAAVKDSFFRVLEIHFNAFSRQVSQPSTPRSSKKRKVQHTPSTKQGTKWADLSANDWKGIFRALLEVDELAYQLPRESRFIQKALDDYPWPISDGDVVNTEDEIIFVPHNYKHKEHWGHILWMFISTQLPPRETIQRDNFCRPV